MIQEIKSLDIRKRFDVKVSKHELEFLEIWKTLLFDIKTPFINSYGSMEGMIRIGGVSSLNVTSPILNPITFEVQWFEENLLEELQQEDRIKFKFVSNNQNIQGISPFVFAEIIPKQLYTKRKINTLLNTIT